MELVAPTPSQASDIDLSLVAIEPTRLSFDDFYEGHAPSVAEALAVTLGDPELAADATSEAMIRAWQRWSKIGAYDNPAAWTYRVGLNWATSWHRRRRRERDRPVSLGPARTEMELRDDRLDEAINALSIEHRAVVVCRIVLDWSVTETALALGIKPGTVKSRLARALDQLRPHAAEEDT